MRTWVLILIGFALKSVGIGWTLQGLNLLGGSSMTGAPLWAVIGAIVFAGGMYVGYLGVRNLRADRAEAKRQT